MKITLFPHLILFIAGTFLFSIDKVNAQTKADSLSGKIFTSVDVEAAFPGGDAGWVKYITKAFQKTDVRWRNSDAGTCHVKFIVDTHGRPINAEAMDMKRTRLAKFAVEIITDGPTWKPASQNGKAVNAWRVQPITLTLESPKSKRE